MNIFFYEKKEEKYIKGVIIFMGNIISKVNAVAFLCFVLQLCCE